MINIDSFIKSLKTALLQPNAILTITQITLLKKILFIDRDGTLIYEVPPTYKIDSFDKLTFYPSMFQYVARIAIRMAWELPNFRRKRFGQFRILLLSALKMNIFISAHFILTVIFLLIIRLNVSLVQVCLPRILTIQIMIFPILLSLAIE